GVVADARTLGEATEADLFDAVLAHDLQRVLQQCRPQIAVVASGLMVLAACLGGPTSNAISVQAGGDAALSISLTAVSSFIAFLTAPLIITGAMDHFVIVGGEVSLPFLETSVRIFATAVLPVTLGMVLGPRYAPLRRSRQRIFGCGFATVLATSALLLIGRAELLASGVSTIAALLLNVSMMTLAFGLSRWLLRHEPYARSITIEVGLQNVSLALVIIVSSLGVLEMLAPTLFYLPIAYVTGFGFAFLMQRGLTNRALQSA
ncbi:MAG: hypothetical protein AAGG11_13265, partial [Pseudomonadota bacterium]